MRSVARVMILCSVGLGACKKDADPPAKGAKSSVPASAPSPIRPGAEAPIGPVSTRLDNSAPTQVSPLPPDAPAAVRPAGAPSDVDLVNQVRQAIFADPTLSRAAQTIDVSANDGVVRLSGTLLSESDRENLRIAVARVRGLRSIDDRIVVKKE